MPRKPLVVDANILIRGVLGHRVRRIIETNDGNVSFFVPELAFAEAERHVPGLFGKRGGDPKKAMGSLKSLTALTKIAGVDLYRDFETAARNRIGWRDSNDWPVLATALALECPIWTEDRDFFGCDVDVKDH